MSAGRGLSGLSLCATWPSAEPRPGRQPWTHPTPALYDARHGIAEASMRPVIVVRSRSPYTAGNEIDRKPRHRLSNGRSQAGLVAGSLDRVNESKQDGPLFRGELGQGRGKGS